jgi:hypothetical protein
MSVGTDPLFCQDLYIPDPIELKLSAIEHNVSRSLVVGNTMSREVRRYLSVLIPSSSVDQLI